MGEHPRASSSSEQQGNRNRPNLLRFGGSAAGEFAPPAETKLSARTTHQEGRKREVKGGGGSQGRVDKEWWASAQEPERADWGKRIWIATLNVDGLMRQGKREEVEKWMKKHNIAFLVLQETHTQQ